MQTQIYDVTNKPMPNYGATSTVTWTHCFASQHSFSPYNCSAVINNGTNNMATFQL